MIDQSGCYRFVFLVATFGIVFYCKFRCTNVSRIYTKLQKDLIRSFTQILIVYMMASSVMLLGLLGDVTWSPRWTFVTFDAHPSWHYGRCTLILFSLLTSLQGLVS